MKYYFITYQATNKQGHVSIWNDVIKETPMDFITRVECVEEMGSGTYKNFIVLNTCKISKEDFDRFDGCF